MKDKILKQSLLKLAKQTGDSLVIKQFNVYKQMMLQDFNDHDVTRELNDGPNAVNISKTLYGDSATGNLFTFIGFNESDDPIKPILNILESARIDFTGLNQKNISAKYRMHIPTAQDIFDVTPMPWAKGRSWAYGIEHGISGLGAFLPKNDAGRSGGGIQRKNSATTGLGIKFRNTKYISEILNNFRSNLRKIRI